MLSNTGAAWMAGSGVRADRVKANVMSIGPTGGRLLMGEGTHEAHLR